jgi:hypothetical protein
VVSTAKKIILSTAKKIILSTAKKLSLTSARAAVTIIFVDYGARSA